RLQSHLKARSAYWEIDVQVRLDSKVVLITGASKGIGLACALECGLAGATVVGVSRSPENLRAAQAHCEAQGFLLKTYAADLAEPDAAERIVDAVEKEVGSIDVLINSAGAARRYAVDELGPAAFRQAMDAKYFTY